MGNRLLIAVLGNRNSGKTTTWKRLFDATVKTGKYERELFLNSAQSVDAFLINGSPEERDVDVEDLLPNTPPSIVLCSTQYRGDVKDTYNYFFRRGYEVFVQWLNPGYEDVQEYDDKLALLDFLLAKGATVQVRDGTADPTSRVREIRQFILGWATYHDLVKTQWPE